MSKTCRFCVGSIDVTTQKFRKRGEINSRSRFSPRRKTERTWVSPRHVYKLNFLLVVTNVPRIKSERSLDSSPLCFFSDVFFRDQFDKFLFRSNCYRTSVVTLFYVSTAGL